ncbi:MAG TPA: ribosome maturation factor RimM [Candidatus Saccharimonadales bacterium]|nr:ribosome maturation factor RimM [Candidatus Saccharimonadales bacterium]
MTGPEPDGLIVGLIRGPHGVRGEVTVDPRTDIADRFRVGATLSCDGIGPLRVASVGGLSAKPFVRFDGYTGRPQAETLQGRFLRVSRVEARRAAGGAYLWADLVGLQVLHTDGTLLGEVSEVLRAGETDVLVITRPATADLLVPALASVVRAIDLAARSITIAPQEEL